MNSKIFFEFAKDCAKSALPKRASNAASKKYLRKYVNLFPQTSVNICGNSKIYLRKYVCVFPQINSRNRGILAREIFHSYSHQCLFVGRGELFVWAGIWGNLKEFWGVRVDGDAFNSYLKREIKKVGITNE